MKALSAAKPVLILICTGLYYILVSCDNGLAMSGVGTYNTGGRLTVINTSSGPIPGFTNSLSTLCLRIYYWPENSICVKL